MIANLSTRIDKAHEVATDAKELASQVSNSVENMPAQIIEAMRRENKGVRLEIKEWIMFALIILAPIATAFWNDIMHPKQPAPIVSPR